MSRGADIQQLRASSLSLLSHAADALRPVSAVVNAAMPPTVARIAAQVNTALMAVLIDALSWVDVGLVEGFVMGFHVVGPISDSGVYRRIASRQPPES